MFVALEDTRTTLEVDRARIQTLNREYEKQMAQSGQHNQTLQEELTRANNNLAQRQNEEKDLQARLNNEIEERERAQQESHQLRKQVN